MQSPLRLTSGASEFPVCGRFLEATRCGCTIPCRVALKEVSLSEIRPGFFISPLQGAYADAELQARGVTHVLNLSETSYQERDFITYCRVDFEDTPGADIGGALPACLRFIAKSLGPAAGGNGGSGGLDGSSGGGGGGGGG